MNTNSNTQAVAPRLLCIKQVQQLTGLGRTMTYDLIGKGKHPAPVKVGRCSRWIDREIYRWIDNMAQQRGL